MAKKLQHDTKPIVPLSKERAAELRDRWLDNHKLMLAKVKMLRVDCGNILLEIKSSLKHKEWTPKLKKLCAEAKIGLSTAQAYMKEAKLDEQLMPDDRKAIVAEGVPLSNRSNLENALTVRETHPDAPPEEVAKIVKQMVPPHGGGVKKNATITTGTPHETVDSGEPESGKPATKGSLKDSALAAYCIQLLDIILGRDEWMGKPDSEKWSAALKLAEKIDKEVPNSYRLPKMPASKIYEAEHLPAAQGHAG